MRFVASLLLATPACAMSLPASNLGSDANVGSDAGAVDASRSDATTDTVRVDIRVDRGGFVSTPDDIASGPFGGPPCDDRGCSADVALGSALALDPHLTGPNFGFAGWEVQDCARSCAPYEGRCTTPAPCRLEVDRRLEITARFEPSLALWLALDGDTLDGSRQGHPGSSASGQWVRRADGQALRFDGSAPVSIDDALPDEHTLSGYATLTACAFVAPASYPARGTAIIVAKAAAPNGLGNPSYALGLDADGYVVGSVWKMDGPLSAVEVHADRSGPIPLGEFSHACLLYNGQEARIALRADVGDFREADVRVPSRRNPTVPFEIGGCQACDDADTVGFDGAIDEVKLWRSLLNRQDLEAQASR
ncbi:MAG: LamG domain-containing protein [Deltaproteobacteria bacterium]|nr:LamG domain-containing protein [Deltaproteobacteria bacterium]